MPAKIQTRRPREPVAKAVDPEPAPATPRRYQRLTLVRWTLLALIVLGTCAAFAVLWLRELPGDPAKYRAFATAGILGVTIPLFLLWILALGPFRFWARLLVVASAFALIVAAPWLFEIKGISGSWVPTVRLRFLPEKQVKGLAAVNAGDVDLLTTTPFDFSQFRGPGRAGTITNVVLDPDWDKRPPKPVWRHQVGPAWSGFAIVGDYAVTMEQDGPDEQVVCYELKTGVCRWRYSYPAELVSDSLHSNVHGPGPRATPTIHKGFVYTNGSTGILKCLDGGNGNEIWSRDTMRDSDGQPPESGITCSPLVVDDMVIVVPGGKDLHTIYAYDRLDGHVIWHNGYGDCGYASPTYAVLAGVPQILFMAQHEVASHNPQTGEILWHYDWGRDTYNIAQPLPVGGNGVFLSSGYGFGCQLLEVFQRRSGRLQVTPCWKRNRNMKFKFTNGVVQGQYVYGLDDGVLACLDMMNGERRWKAGRYGHGQILLVGDYLFVQGEFGDLYLVKATPERHEEVAHFKALDDKCWTTPALSGSRLLVRSSTEAVCLELPVID